MKDWIYRMRLKIQRWMYGRNGLDELGKAVYMSGLVIIVVNFFSRSVMVSSLAMALFIYVIYRCCSKDIKKRREENIIYNEWLRKQSKYVEVIKLNWKYRKTNRYYICKACGQIIRVPKGKGRIEIVCPNCKHIFIKRT